MLTTQRSMQTSLRWLRRILVVILIVSNFATVMLADAAGIQQDSQPSLPIRAAFYDTSRETGANAPQLIISTR